MIAVAHANIVRTNWYATSDHASEQAGYLAPPAPDPPFEHGGPN